MKTGTIVLGVGGLAAVSIGTYLLLGKGKKVRLEADTPYYLTYVGKSVIYSEALTDILDIIVYFYYWTGTSWVNVALSDHLVPSGHYGIKVTEPCTLKNFEIWEE